MYQSFNHHDYHKTIMRCFYLLCTIFLIQASLLPLYAQEPIAQQVDFNVTLISNRQVDFSEDLNSQYHRYSDVWGYVAPDSTEYAIIGTGMGTAIYDLSDPAQPELVVLIPGAPSRWRDYKTHDQFIFGVADEGADGLLIVNMQSAPEDITWTYWRPSLTTGTDQSRSLDKCHNLYIDSGHAFLAGCNLNGGGVLIFDLKENPMEPSLITAADPKYAHDVYVQNNLMFTSDLGQGFAIVDISDIANPQTQVIQETSFDFTHNAWASEENQYLFTTDERVGAMVDAYDISDPDEIMLLDQYRPSATLRNGVIPHNVHYFQGYLVISYYIDGLKIVDAHDPTNLVEVGSYDTYKFRDDGFHGAWGAFPYLPSGLILVSDIESGLYVLKPDYQRAAYLSGEVTDAITGESLPAVTVQIISPKPGLTTTDELGKYSTGWAGTGPVTVSFEKIGYRPQSRDIDLIQADYSILNVQLQPLEQRTVTGFVVDATSGLPIPAAQVVAYNQIYEFRNLTDTEGRFQMQVPEGDYIIAAGNWGHIHNFETVTLDSDLSEVRIELDSGYRDDFIFDYGWSVQNSRNTSPAQGWQRGNPRYAIYNFELTNPNGDLEGDLGSACFVTGLAGNLGANLSDTSVLTSPLFDISSYNDPYLNYFTWFYDFGVLPSDDDLKIYLGNGEQEVLIETISSSSSGWRTQSQIRVLDFLPASSDMYIKIFAADVGNIHIYESAIDAFSITDGKTTPADDQEFNFSLNVFPNPTHSRIYWDLNSVRFTDVSVYDFQGRLLTQDKNPVSNYISVERLQPGTYILAFANKGRLIKTQKFIKN